MKNKVILFKFCPICYELLHTLCRKDGVDCWPVNMNLPPNGSSKYNRLVQYACELF